MRVFIVGSFLIATLAHATPFLPEQLQLRVAINLGSDLGGASSAFNPRIFDGDNFVNQINSPMGFGRYPSGSSVAEIVINNTALPLEHRMVAPFRGINRTTYMMGSGSGAALNGLISRYDFDGAHRVDAATPGGQTAEGFDWVDDNTIIYTDYNSGNRKRLYLTDVVADPFSLSSNPAWNSSGFITTSVTTRVRNVRVGDVYSGFAYYGDAGQNNNPNFYAVNLATGAETLLGNAGTLTGGGSFGVWTVLERGGYLYVQTTDNGVQVYNLTSATSLGSQFTTYTKAELDAVTGGSAQYFGLDVTPDGSKLLLGGIAGLIYELGAPTLTISQSGTDVILSWPTSVNSVVLQHSVTLSPPNFTELDPQPAITSDGVMNTAVVPISTAAEFFRLRKL
ncbi:MAG: hypothetical protein ABIQ35_03225 [Verrucomicrobiota bacterium]